MILKKITIENFRSFFGQYSFDFSDDPKKKITIFLGENGGGKTNLINAIFWCLTGKLTPTLSRVKKNIKRSIVNNEIIKEFHDEKAIVDLTFDHQNKTYRITRSIDKYEKEESSIVRVDDTGNSIPVPAGKFFIKSLIPDALSNWFFYDAEAIGSLNLDGTSDLRGAIRKTLGFELIDNAIEDLESAVLKKRRKAQASVSNSELDKLSNFIENKKLALADKEEKISSAQEKYDTAKQALEEANLNLKNVPDIKSIQQNRENEEKKLKNEKIINSGIKDKISNFFGISFPSLLLSNVADNFKKNLILKENKGQIPSRHRQDVLEDILEDETCICGREVKRGSKEEKELIKLLKDSTSSDFNRRIKYLQSTVREIETVTEQYNDGLKDLSDLLEQSDKRITDHETKIREYTSSLEGHDSANVNALEEIRSLCITQRENAFKNLEDTKANFKTIEDDLILLTKKYKELSDKLGFAENNKKIIDKVERLKDFLIKTVDYQESQSIKILQEELNKNLDSFLSKNYSAKIDTETYAITMIDNSNNLPVDSSTGEYEVLKYAFISTVLALASKKTSEKIDFIAEPIIAPLTMDAPFTSLGEEYKKVTALNIAKCSSQLILMMLPGVIKEKQIFEALEPYIGKKYAVISEQAGEKGNKVIRKHNIFGKEIEFDIFGVKFSGSKVVDINEL